MHDGDGLTGWRRAEGDQVQSLSRAVSLLRILAYADGEAMRLGDIVVASGLHKATVHRMLGALIREGLVQQDGSGGYTLGPELSLFGAVASKRFNISVMADAVLDRIAERTGDVAVLFVRSGPNAVCIGRKEGEAPLIPGVTRVGTIKPLGVGAGPLALLMGMDAAEADAIPDRDEEVRTKAYPLFTADYLRRQLCIARQEGFSFDDQSITPGVRAVGVPVRDSQGRLLASLSCTAFADRLPPSRRHEMAAMLQEEAAGIMQRLSPPVEAKRRRRAVRIARVLGRAE